MSTEVKMSEVTILYPDGKENVCSLNLQDPKEIQKIVGGYFDCLFCKDMPDHVLLINEEGAYKGLKVNVKATKLLGATLVGTVILAKTKDM